MKILKTSDYKRQALSLALFFAIGVYGNCAETGAGLAGMKDSSGVEPPLGKVSLNRIRQVSVVVKNLDKAIDFYSKVLNLRLAGKFEQTKTAVVACGEVNIFLQSPEDAGTSQASSTLYFQVDDIVAERKKLADKGVLFEQDIHQIGGTSSHGNLWMTFFHDPDGNYMSLTTVMAPEIKIVKNEYTLVLRKEGYSATAVPLPKS